MKKIVCIVILILAITGLLNGISYLISGISARGIGGVNYGRVIFPLLVGAIAVYFFKKGEEKIENFRVEKSEPLEKVCGKIYIREVYKSEAVEEKHYEKNYVW